MAAAVKQQTGTILHLASGYRSPAYQLYLMCAGSYQRSKAGENPSLKKEFTLIAPPFCSRHSDAVSPALDVEQFFPNRANSIEHSTTCDEVRKSIAWKVFTVLAQEAGFYENYPEGSINNGHGEPWEFQYRRSST